MLFYLPTGERTKRSLSEEKERKNSFSGETTSYKEKYLEVMVVADHLYLQKFDNDNEATEILLTLIHMVSVHLQSRLTYMRGHAQKGFL